MKLHTLVALTAFGGMVTLLPASSTAQPAQPTKAADQLKATVEKATAFLKKSQGEDGGWGKAGMNEGVTGIVVAGLLRTGTKPGDAPVAAGLKFIEKLVNKKEGHIAGDTDKATIINYKTSINVMALSAADKEKYKVVIANAVKYLKEYQWDEARGKKDDSDYYGGAGYAGDKSRPDLSNTAFFLEALKDAGVSQDDPAFKKALVFVGRCQNFKSEFNKAPWAEKNNDGSFVYTGANGGENRRDDAARTTDLGGYGSMTYAGVKSMIYCGAGKEDPRVKKALEWIGKNYTLDANPGMPEASKLKGLFYYYHTFAKAMNALGDDTFTDAKGAKHDWRADLIAAIAKRQKEDGSFVNDSDKWMEGDANLVTGYALMALSYCKK